MMEQCRLPSSSQIRVRRAVCVDGLSGSSDPPFDRGADRASGDPTAAGCRPLVDSIWGRLSAMPTTLYLAEYSAALYLWQYSEYVECAAAANRARIGLPVATVRRRGPPMRSRSSTAVRRAHRSKTQS